MSSLAFDFPSITLTANGSQQLELKGTAVDGTALSGLTATAWTSSDPTVVSVSADGVLTAVKPGTATITASLSGMSTSVPVTVSAIAVKGMVSTAVAGSVLSCGLTTNGNAYCWGALWDGLVHPTPTAVGGNHTFKTLSVSSTSYGAAICGLDLAGSPWCWGTNMANLSQKFDVPAALPGTHVFETLEGHDEHFLATKADGTVWAWGRDNTGAFGIDPAGGWVSFATPTQVLPSHRFKVLRQGPNGTTCGIKEDESGWCWGTNSYSETGTWRGDMVWTPVPQPVPGGYHFKDIRPNGVNTTGLTTDGRLIAWGTPATSSTGPGFESAPKSYSYMAPTDVSNGLRFAELTSHAAITTDGDLYVWYGGAMWASSANRVAPGSKLAGAPRGLTGLVTSYVNGFAIDANGTVWSWGLNEYGELGRGTIDYNDTSPKPPAIVAEDFQVGVLNGGVTLTRGSTAKAAITVNRLGSLNINGVGSSLGNISLSATGLPAGVTATFSPATVGRSSNISQLTLTASSSATIGTAGVTVSAVAAGKTHTTMVGVSVVAPPPPASSTPGIPAGQTLTCSSASTNLGVGGYQCMQNDAGQLVPGWFGSPKMQGTWVDETSGSCLIWNADGTATGRYKAAQLGGTTTVTASGKWGVITRSNGVPEGTSTQWYVFTGNQDPQLALLGWDDTAQKIVGWDFVKKACPW